MLAVVKNCYSSLPGRAIPVQSLAIPLRGCPLEASSRATRRSAVSQNRPHRRTSALRRNGPTCRVGSLPDQGTSPRRLPRQAGISFRRPAVRRTCLGCRSRHVGPIRSLIFPRSTRYVPTGSTDRPPDTSGSTPRRKCCMLRRRDCSSGRICHRRREEPWRLTSRYFGTPIRESRP